MGVAQSWIVWDKMATCWAGEKDWLIAEKRSKFARGQVQVHHLHLEQNEALHRTQKNRKQR